MKITDVRQFISLASPSSSVTVDADGALYGIANEGGSCTFDDYGCGTVWMIKP